MLPPRTETPVSRTSLSSTSKFDLSDYNENHLDINNVILSHASKMSFNESASDIIDIDFEQYNEEVETPTEKIDESDDEFNKSRIFFCKVYYQPTVRSLLFKYLTRVLNYNGCPIKNESRLLKIE